MSQEPRREPVSTGIGSLVKLDKKAVAPVRAEGISVNEACALFGVSKTTLYSMERAGRLLGLRIGNRVYYSRQQLVEVLGRDSICYPGASAA